MQGYRDVVRTALRPAGERARGARSNRMRFARAGQCSMVGGEGRSSCRTQIRRFRFMADTPVASELVGAVWPAAHPGEDPLLYGHVELQPKGAFEARSEEHKSELQSLMRISYAVFCLKKK